MRSRVRLPEGIESTRPAAAFLLARPPGLPIPYEMALALGFYASLLVAGWLIIGSLNRGSNRTGTRAFALFGVFIAAWSIGEFVALSATNSEQILLARRLLFFGAAGLPPTWLWLSARADRPDWFVRHPQSVAAAFVVPFVIYSCLYWDHSLRFVDWTSSVPAHGPWFDVFTHYQ